MYSVSTVKSLNDVSNCNLSLWQICMADIPFCDQIACNMCYNASHLYMFITAAVKPV